MGGQLGVGWGGGLYGDRVGGGHPRSSDLIVLLLGTIHPLNSQQDFAAYRERRGFIILLVLHSLTQGLPFRLGRLLPS